MRQILHEPLLHFIVLGLLLFPLFSYFSPDESSNQQRIVIDDQVVGSIIQRFQRVWERPPSAEEMKVQLEDYVYQQVLYRQGVSYGLLDDDPVIRARVAQKMQLIVEENADLSLPNDERLDAYRLKHISRYTSPASYSFIQIYFDSNQLGNNTQQTVSRALAALQKGAPYTNYINKQSLLPVNNSNLNEAEIARVFSKDFADALSSLALGSWQGPIISGLGVHLVKLTERQKPEALPLPAVREELKRDWMVDAREDARRRYIESAVADYDVQIEADIPKPALPELP